jgi:hypothetical protein
MYMLFVFWLECIMRRICNVLRIKWLRLSFIACAADIRSGSNSVERAGDLANAAQRVEIDVERQARCAERR